MDKSQRREIGAKIAELLKNDPLLFVVNDNGKLNIEAIHAQIQHLIDKEKFYNNLRSIMDHARNFYSGGRIIAQKDGWALKNKRVNDYYAAEEQKKVAAVMEAKKKLRELILGWPRWEEFLAERTPISLAKKEIIAFLMNFPAENQYEAAVVKDTIDNLKKDYLPDILKNKAVLFRHPAVPTFLGEANSKWKEHLQFFKSKDPKRWEKISAYDAKYREKYFKKHGTTEKEATQVWERIGGVGPVPVPGFWNVGSEAHFSTWALGEDQQFSLLSHHGLHYRPKSLRPVGIGHTSYGETRVYKTSDIQQYQERAAERKKKLKPPQVFDFQLSTIVKCLVLVNRRARRLSRLVPQYYQMDMHGLCGYFKDTKNALYQLKDAVLLRIAHLAQKREWHLSDNGWLAYFAFELSSGKQFGFHLPCTPNESVLPNEEEAKYIDSIPVIGSPRFTIQGHTLRLKDAVATLEKFVRTEPIPKENREIEEWHYRAKQAYRETGSFHQWRLEWEEDQEGWEDEDWENEDWEDEYWKRY